MHLYCIQSIEDKNAVRTCFNFKCTAEYTVKFLYQGHDVFDICVPLWRNTPNFYRTLIDIVLLNKDLRDFIFMWYKESKPSNTFFEKIKKTTNATSDIDSFNSLYYTFKGR